MPIVEAPDGKVIEFPDSMPEAAINGAMAKEYPAPVAPWKKTVSQVARPTLEGLGMAGGAAVGGASGLLAGPGAVVASPAGALVGGGLGYAAGAGIADRLDEMLGLKKPPTLSHNLVETGGNVVKGAAMEAGGQLGGAALMKGAEYVAPRLYGSAAKFSTTLSPSDKISRIETALDNKILPNEAGVDKLTGLKNKLGQEIDDLIASAPSGTTIPREDVAKKILDLIPTAKASDFPEDATASLMKIYNKFLMQQPREMTIQNLQAMKKGIYERLATQYAKTTYTPLETLAEKKLAQGAKEGIESVFPEVKGMNAEEGAYLELMDSIPRAASRIFNRNPLSLQGGIGAAAGAGVGALAGHPYAGATAGGIVANILQDPIIMARVAIALNSVSKVPVSVKDVGLRLAAYSLANPGKVIGGNK
jgi:hypothetical protein